MTFFYLASLFLNAISLRGLNFPYISTAQTSESSVGLYMPSTIVNHYTYTSRIVLFVR